MADEAADPRARFSAETPFSYRCARCRRCCHDKLIQVNPYEAARLARNRGISTTAFFRDFLEGSVYLRRRDDGACVFLGDGGCTVHADRPLVCRLYPLGRHVLASGEVNFSRLEPHSHSEGVFGREGTVAGYLATQDIERFVAAADRYLALLSRLNRVWWGSPSELDGEGPEDDAGFPELMDLDRAVAQYCTEQGAPEPLDIEERMRLHIAAVEQWLDANEAGS